MLRFKSEDERVEALNALDPEVEGASEKLEEIRSAEIGEAEPADTTPESGNEEGDVEDGKGTKEPEEAAGGEDPDKNKEGEVVEKYEITDLKGFKSVGELLKDFDEKQALIERQQTFIREKLESQQQVDPEVMKRLETAERELAEFKSKQSTPTTPKQEKTDANIDSVQSEIERLSSLQDELDQQAEGDPDVVYTAEYQKKQRGITRMLNKNVASLTGLYRQASTEAAEAKKTASEYVNSQKESEEDKRAKEALDAEYQQMNEVSDPEFKLSKPSKDVEGEYIEWRKKIATAHFGRPPNGSAEAFEALNQLQLKNPELLNKCRLMGYDTQPSKDVEKYIELCEAVSYRDGYRKNPATGKWDANTRIMVYDQATKKSVPYIMPSIDAAIKQMRLESGYYDKKADGAYQEGAEALAAAASRRDQGAITLDGGADQGQTKQSTEWAFKLIAETDAEQAVIEHRNGDSSKLNEINKARKILGQDPITL